MKKINFKSVLLTVVIVGIGFIACNKEDTPVNTPPTSPVLNSPSDASTIEGLSTVLNWQTSTDAESNTITYDVYLGTESEPVTKVSENQVETSYTIDDMINLNTYHWRVVASDGSISKTSPTWSFGTNAILGKWKSDTIVHPKYGLKFVQSHVFNADGTGSIVQTGELTASFTLTWSVVGTELYLDLNETEYKDTVYHAFENKGNTMIFKESEVTPDVEARFHRVKE